MLPPLFVCLLSQRAMIEDETRKVVLDMITKAEEEAIRNELERIAREAAIINVEDGE